MEKRLPLPFVNEKSGFRVPYEEALNLSQLEAVTIKEGPLLVIAGAGSGKTRTLTYRVARLVEEGVPPASILLLTFTRKAAHEMLTRAAQLLDHRCAGVSGGTFHSFSNTVLRKYASKVGLNSSFSILDRPDAESLISMLRKEMGLESKFHSFPRKHTLANIFSRAVNKVITIEDVLFDDYPHFSAFAEAVMAVYRGYGRRKAEHRFLDYDDLLVYLKLLLSEHPGICEELSSTYQYLMVDEYQDTNQLQAEIVFFLSHINRNIMVVGDDSQSIYAFRGANFKNIMKFPEMFPGTKIIKLEENYRSVQPILDLANVIIDRAEDKYTKSLFTRRPGGSVPVLVCTRDENSQSRFLVEKIHALSRKGISLNRIAVLFRASFHSFDLEIELIRNGIPFIKVGGFKFMESGHIKDVLAHLRVVSNPNDQLSWFRILLLLDKIGPKTAQNIYAALLEERDGYMGLFSIKFPSGSGSGIGRLKTLFSKIDSMSMSVAEIGEVILDYYGPILREKYDDHPKREKDIEHLLIIMERYSSLDQFLTDMALEPPTNSVGGSLYTDYSSDERLTLSTVHSAKGLEWHTVFVIWTLDGRFPSIHAVRDEENLEEELRLMYVAATRAKENLFFTYPMQVYDRSSGMILSCPSRFLDKIPDDILRKHFAAI